LLFKEAYAVGAEVEEADATTLDQRIDEKDIGRIADSVCRSLASTTRGTYVGSGKRTSEVFERYIETVKEIILGEFGGSASDGVSYYEHLRAKMPGLSKLAYSRDHRTVMEYLAKRAKKLMRDELKKM
jgi:hypothetical protein